MSRQNVLILTLLPVIAFCIALIVGSIALVDWIRAGLPTIGLNIHPTWMAWVVSVLIFFTGAGVVYLPVHGLIVRSRRKKRRPDLDHEKSRNGPEPFR